jgi:hypothetical protein
MTSYAWRSFFPCGSAGYAPGRRADRARHRSRHENPRQTGFRERRRGLDHPMAGVILLVISSFVILVGSIAVSGLRFANAAYFFVPFLVGAMTEGGHDFIDVIGGCLCAVAGIALAQALYNAGVASRLMRAASRALAPISVASVRPKIFASPSAPRLSPRSRAAPFRRGSRLRGFCRLRRGFSRYGRSGARISHSRRARRPRDRP